MTAEWLALCSGGDCPQVRKVDGWIELRDSARPTEVVRFDRAQFASLLVAVEDGELDHLLA